MIFYAICFDTRFNGQAGGLYLGAMLGALIEFPAYVLLEPLANRAGRKLAFSACLALTALCLCGLHAVSGATYALADPSRARVQGASTSAASSAEVDASDPEQFNWVACMLVLGGRFASVAAVNVAYIVAAEIFPTSCRNSGIGWGTGCGRVGAIIAPAIMLGWPSPLLLFGGLSLLAAGLVWLLPESVGLELLDVPTRR